MPMFPDMVGQKIEDYEIEALIGIGATSTVYRGVHIISRQEVAIKILPSTLANHPVIRKRFEREAQTLATLVHPNICPIYSYGHHDGTAFIVMKLLSGRTLGDWLEGYCPAGLPLETVSDILLAMASALDYAHQRDIIHRDVKLDNVMFDDEGYLYVIDFGIAKTSFGTSPLTDTDVIVGTPHYIAPERWLALDATPRSDQYALGVLVYQLCTGQLPFSANDMSDMMYQQVHQRATPMHHVRPELPESLDTIVNTALSKDPAHRFRSAMAFAKLFENVVVKSLGNPIFSIS